jgi:putative DNA primase/helicase
MAGGSNWEGLLVEVETKAGAYPKSCGANVEIILVHCKEWKEVLAFDEFAGCIVFRKEPPWCAESRDGVKQQGALWTDEDATRLVNWLARSKWGINVTSNVAQEVVNVVAKKNRFHPVKDFLQSLKWDGKARIDDWLIRLAGADDSPMVRAASAKFLIAAVARVYEPGCQVDTVPIFEGKQGIGKTSLVRCIAMREEWHLETNIELGNKDSYQLLRRKWIIEWAELDSLNRSELSRAKAYISNPKDTYRPSYGRGARDFPRQCVFVGTTNAGEYLKDDTGARRFWPIEIRTVDLKALKRERLQLWAEAVSRYKAGEAWYITDRQLAASFEKEQEARRQIDPWEPIIADYLHHGYRDEYGEHKSPPGKTVSISTILIGPLGVDVARISRAEHMRVGAIMRKLGWERRQTYIGSEYAGYEYFRPPRKTASGATGGASDGDEKATGKGKILPFTKQPKTRGINQSRHLKTPQRTSEHTYTTQKKGPL